MQPTKKVQCNVENDVQKQYDGQATGYRTSLVQCTPRDDEILMSHKLYPVLRPKRRSGARQPGRPVCHKGHYDTLWQHVKREQHLLSQHRNPSRMQVCLVMPLSGSEV